MGTCAWAAKGEETTYPITQLSLRPTITGISVIAFSKKSREKATDSNPPRSITFSA